MCWIVLIWKCGWNVNRKNDRSYTEESAAALWIFSLARRISSTASPCVRAQAEGPRAPTWQQGPNKRRHPKLQAKTRKCCCADSCSLYVSWHSFKIMAQSVNHPREKELDREVEHSCVERPQCEVHRPGKTLPLEHHQLTRHHAARSEGV